MFPNAPAFELHLDVLRKRVPRETTATDPSPSRYEDRIAQLEREVEARGGPSQNSHGSSQPQPPQIGHGPSNLFGGIMAGSAAQGGPGLAPPPQEPQQPQGMPPHLGPQGPPGLNPAPGPPQHFGGYQPGGPPSVNGKLHTPSHVARGFTATNAARY
jgi:glucose repression regulatory protein TUP1